MEAISPLRLMDYGHHLHCVGRAMFDLDVPVTHSWGYYLRILVPGFAVVVVLSSAAYKATEWWPTYLAKLVYR